MWVGNILRGNRKTDKGRRGQRTKYVLDVPTHNTYLSPSQSNDYGAGMHGGVVLITARTGVHGMTMGSPLDDEERHSPDYWCTGEATFQ